MPVSRIEGRTGTTYRVDKYDGDGKRIRRRFKRMKDAQAFDRAPLDRVVEALSETVRDTGFTDLAEHFLEWVKVNRAEKTYDSYYHVVWPSLVPAFGQYRLSQITVDMIERHKARRLKDVKPVTVNMDLTILRIMWKHAIKHGWAHTDTAARVGKLREQEPDHKAFGKTDIERILQASSKYWVYPLMITVAHTGMRQKEALALTWDDVDFEEGVLHVTGAKNYANRLMNMTPQVRAALLECRAGHSDEHEHVFEFRRKPIKRGPYKTLRRIAADVGVPQFGLHSLRHTFATHLAAAGVAGHHVQKSLGHKHYASTARYMDYDRIGYRSTPDALGYGQSLPSGLSQEPDAEND